eukprot:jgi/Chlat1/6398/Chrsp45S05915
MVDALETYVRTEIASNDGNRQTQALLAVLHDAAAGRDTSSVASYLVEAVIVNGDVPSLIGRRLAYDILRTARLPHRNLDTLCSALAGDLGSPAVELRCSALAFLSSLPSKRLLEFIRNVEHAVAVSACITHESPAVRRVAIDALKWLLVREDVLQLAGNSLTTGDSVRQACVVLALSWWNKIGDALCDSNAQVASKAYEGVGRLFAAVDSENAERPVLVDRGAQCALFQSAVQVCELMWSKRALILERNTCLPSSVQDATCYPLAFCMWAQASGEVSRLKTEGSVPHTEAVLNQSELALTVADLGEQLVTSLTSSNAALAYEAAVALFKLCTLPSLGRSDWATTAVVALLSICERPEYSSGREVVLSKVMENVHLADAHAQLPAAHRVLALTRGLPSMFARLRILVLVGQIAFSRRVAAWASSQHGELPPPQTSFQHLWDDRKSSTELTATMADSMYREELLASLVEACLSIHDAQQGLRDLTPAAMAVVCPKEVASPAEAALGWQLAAVELAVLLRPCLGWDCDSRLYAADAYVRLVALLCRNQGTVISGAAIDIVGRSLHSLLLNIFDGYGSFHIDVQSRVLWLLGQHMAVDPDDVIVEKLESMMQRLVVDETALGDHQGCWWLQLLQERPNLDSLQQQEYSNRGKSRLVKDRLATVVRRFLESKPDMQPSSAVNDGRLIGSASSEYPFGFAVLDREFYETLHRAMRPISHQRVGRFKDTSARKQRRAQALTGGSDPLYMEATHTANAQLQQLTLSIRVVNVVDFEVKAVTLQVGLRGGLSLIGNDTSLSLSLPSVLPEEAEEMSFQLQVSAFDRSELLPKITYLPDAATSTDDDEGGFNEGSPRENGEASTNSAFAPVILPCLPYIVPLTDLLRPLYLRPSMFYSVWAGLPASATLTCASRPQKAGAYGSSILESYVASIEARNFAKIHSRVLPEAGGPLQVCYAAKTWYQETVELLIVLRHASAIAAIPQVTCKLHVRAASEEVLRALLHDPAEFIADMTAKKLRYLPPAEPELAESPQALAEPTLPEFMLSAITKPPLVAASATELPRPSSTDSTQVASVSGDVEPSSMSVSNEAESGTVASAVNGDKDGDAADSDADSEGSQNRTDARPSKVS